MFELVPYMKRVQPLDSLTLVLYLSASLFSPLPSEESTGGARGEQDAMVSVPLNLRKVASCLANCSDCFCRHS